jgi:PAS domain-containing protein
MRPVETSLRHVPLEHVVHFYDHSDQLAQAVAAHLAAGLSSGKGALVVATPPHRAAIEAKLNSRGVDTGPLRAKRQYVELDAAETLERFMSAGRPDAGKFIETISSALGSVSRPSARVFGEMVAVLWRDGNRGAALELERLWNDYCSRHGVSLLCGYPMQGFGGDADAKVIVDVCGAHSGVVLSSETGQAKSVASSELLTVQLHQRSLALDGEIDRRKSLEEALTRRERELVEVLELIGDHVIDIDADGKVRFANRASLEHLQYARGEFMGKSLGDFLQSPGVLSAAWASVVRGERVADVELALRRSDGDLSSLRLRTAILRVVNGSIQMRWFLTTP